MKKAILALFVLYLPFQLHVWQVPIMNTTNLFLIILLFMMIAEKNVPGRICFTLPLLLFFLVWFGSFMHTVVDPRFVWAYVAATEFKRLATLVLVYFVFSKVLKTREEVHFIFGVFIFTLFLVAVDTARSGTLSGDHFADFKRASGPFGQDFMASDIAGGFLTTFTPFVFAAVLFARRNISLLLLVIVFALCITGILTTYSRGSIFALISALALVILFALAHLKKAGPLAVLMIIGILVAGVLGWQTWVPKSITDRIQGTVKESSSTSDAKLDESSERRIDIWKSSMALFRSDPLIGIGFKQTENALGVDPHNAFLLIAVEMGLVGLLVFVWLLVAIFIEAVALINTEFIVIGIGGVGFLMAFVIVNMFYSNFFRDTVAGSFWVMLGIIASAKRVADPRLRHR